jgi:hypothetical protein
MLIYVEAVFKIVAQFIIDGQLFLILLLYLKVYNKGVASYYDSKCINIIYANFNASSLDTSTSLILKKAWWL